MHGIRSKLKSVGQFRERGKVVMVRAGFDGELKDGKLADNSRLRAALPTLEHLVSLGSRILIVAHFGRPHGELNPLLSLRPAAENLSEIMGRKFVVIDDERPVFPSYPVPHIFFYGGDFKKLDKGNFESQMSPGDILVLENIRFYPGEEEMNERFAKDLAALGDFYVNEAFNVCHHPSVSTVLVPKVLPHYAGLQLLKELEALDYVLRNARKPLVLVILATRCVTSRLNSKTLPLGPFFGWITNRKTR